MKFPLYKKSRFAPADKLHSILKAKAAATIAGQQVKMDQIHHVIKRSAGSPYLGNRGGRGLAVSIIFTALATFFVSIRIYTRKTIMKRMEPNDWMILVALVIIFPPYLTATR